MDGLQMPMFGRASDQPPSNNWGGDIDNFDVDLLAEYLLEDDDMASNGVTFDFNLEASQNAMQQQQLPTSMISPDNSEDGAHPPIADKGQRAMAIASGALLGQNHFLQMAPQMMPSNNFMTAQGGLVLSYDFNNNAVMTEADASNKRRRLDSMPQLNQQQLAQAAAQAMAGGRGRKKSQAQIDRRRERNRILARRTRLRKKFFFESLQKEVMDLQRENEILKDIVKDELDADEGKKLLDECDAMEKLPPSILEQCAQESAMDNQDMNLVKSIQKSQHAFVITDPSLQDNPIVFASDDFLKITGYKREQVLGRNCRFLQGEDTNKEDVVKMHKAIAAGEDVSVTLLNYTENGTPFWNKLFIAALRDAQYNIVNYIGVIVHVAGPDPTEAQLNGERDDDEDDDDEEEVEDTVKAIEDSVSAAVAAAAAGL